MIMNDDQLHKCNSATTDAEWQPLASIGVRREKLFE
jgi:hypothetical protein